MKKNILKKINPPSFDSLRNLRRFLLFEVLRKSHFFQELSILACRPHDIRNPLIKSNKKKLRVLPH
jgi:hypothetical protein